MEAICCKNEGHLLSINDVKAGSYEKTCYKGISIDKLYTIYGIVIFRGSIKYLIFDDYEMVNWYPAELFIITDGKISSLWYYHYRGNNEFGISAIWGYNELVFSDEHYTGLCEQDIESLNLFMERKKQIDTIV